MKENAIKPGGIKKMAGSVLFTLSDLKMRYLLDKITVLIFAHKQLSNQKGRVTFIFFSSLQQAFLE